MNGERALATHAVESSPKSVRLQGSSAAAGLLLHGTQPAAAAVRTDRWSCRTLHPPKKKPPDDVDADEHVGGAAKSQRRLNRSSYVSNNI